MCDLYGASGPEVVANTLLEVYGKSQFKGDIDASGVKLIVKSTECDDVVTLDKFASGVIKHIGIGMPCNDALALETEGAIKVGRYENEETGKHTISKLLGKYR